MSEATLTSKGQITIPKRVRDALGLSAGDRVDFVDADNGVLMVPAKRDLKTLRGMFKGRREKAATIHEINDAINSDAGCEVTFTFDRTASKLPGFQLLQS